MANQDTLIGKPGYTERKWAHTGTGFYTEPAGLEKWDRMKTKQYKEEKNIKSSKLASLITHIIIPGEYLPYKSTFLKKN